jgi:nucleotide-binding universal stress UspA family protein
VIPGRIIVGVDGSERSINALRWAAGHAAATGSAIDVVTAWEGSVERAVRSTTGVAAVGAGALSGMHDLDTDLASAARDTARRCVELAGINEHHVPVRTWAIRGSGASVLLDLVCPGDLLVLGQATHGMVAGALLGSVTARVVCDARCPVVVVPDPD